MRLGMHLPISDGLAAAAQRAQALGCQALQIFCGNPRGYVKPPLDPARAAEFRAAVQAAGLEPVVVHATYLINLAAPDEDIYRLSLEALVDEVRRAAALGAQYYVIHCGSHKGTGEEAGRARIHQALQRAGEQAPAGVTVLLENTAGTQHSLGTTFQDLAKLLQGAPPLAGGICFDTCHALAAGYEIRTPEGVAATLDELESVLGLSRLRCLHLNDSRGALGSRLDRHEHIGAGAIGTDGFRAFLGEPRLRELPALLETPLDEPDDDVRNMSAIMELACAAGAVDRLMLERMPTQKLPPVGPPVKLLYPSRQARSSTSAPRRKLLKQRNITKRRKTRRERKRRARRRS